MVVAGRCNGVEIHIKSASIWKDAGLLNSWIEIWSRIDAIGLRQDIQGRGDPEFRVPAPQPEKDLCA